MNVHFLEKWLLCWKLKGQRLIYANISLPGWNGSDILFILLRCLNPICVRFSKWGNHKVTWLQQLQSSQEFFNVKAKKKKKVFNEYAVYNFSFDVMWKFGTWAVSLAYSYFSMSFWIGEKKISARVILNITVVISRVMLKRRWLYSLRVAHEI